jgi:hypothetical protein
MLAIHKHVLGTRSKSEVDAYIRNQRLDAVKPSKKTVLQVKYGNVCIIDIKQKAEEMMRGLSDDASKIDAFQRILSAKYVITKPTATTDGVVSFSKTTKRDVLRDIGKDIDGSKVTFELQVRHIYEVQDRNVAVVVAHTADKGTYDVYIDSASEDALRAFQTRQSSSKSSTKSITKPSSLSSSSTKAAQTWVLPNRSGFVSWAYKKFHPDVYANGVGHREGQMNLFPHQKIIRDFMHFESPYRGVLLYHGLGVGKTCASIAAAEGFIQQHKKVYVMVPASLAQNYKNEIMRCASIGNPKTKLWNITSVPTEKSHPQVQRIMDVYGIPYETIKKHHRKLWLPFITDGVTFSRRNVSWNSLGEKERSELMDYMQDYIDAKYTFISYNGITSKGVDALGTDPFSDSFVVMDEAHNFISRVANGGKVARRLFRMLMDSKGSKLALLSGTPVINHPFELSLLLNLVRGGIKVYRYGIKDQAKVADLEAALQNDDVLKYVDFISIASDKKHIEMQLLPTHFVRGDGIAIKSEPWSIDESGIEALIRKALQRVVRVQKPHIRETFALPDVKENFQKMFLDESDPDNPIVKNMDVFMRRILGMVSYYKTAGEEYFPTVLPRVLEKVPMTNYQFAQYVDVRDEERRMETRAKRQNAMAAGLFAKKGTVYRAFSRMACNFVFPEYIERPFPGNIRKQLVKEIAQDTEDLNPEEQQEMEEEDVDKKVQKEYDTKLKAALDALTRTPEGKSSPPLQLQNIHDMYSPKFAKIAKDIIESPGSCLLYSQFRTVEGLGIMRLVLQEAGFIEVDVEKHGGSWRIVNAEAVFDPKYNGKRYVVFHEDREKTNVLIKLFNGAFADIPMEIPAEYPNNLYGQFIRVLMISQSGAEGISLRNVRRVLITEPFWNKVRIDQVIGRAVRTGSHLDLPEKERNVQVFMYTSTFTEKQLEDNFTLKRLDNSQTSDEHILEIADHKSRIIDQFLTMMKQAALDCAANARQNSLFKSNNIQCYAFPVNMDEGAFSYLPDMEDEKNHIGKAKFERKRNVTGRVVNKNGKKYVVIDGLHGLYDYNAYKDAGILVAS